MSTYRSAAHRVEAHLFPMLLLSVLIAGVSDADKETPEYKAAVSALLQAQDEAVSDMPAKDRAKIIRRSGRLSIEVLRPYEEAETNAAKVALIVYHVLRELIEADYFVLADGPMRDGVEFVMSACEHAAEIEPVMRSAEKQAAKLLLSLRAAGYFGGLAREETAA